MKTIKILTTFAVLLLFAGSCYIDNLETISGNGKVVKQQRKAKRFSELKVATGIDVIITQSDHDSITVVADENLVDYIKTEVIDNVLKIYCDKNIRHAVEKKVYVDYRKLNAIDISSAGDVSGNNTLVTDNLDIEMSSAGDLSLTLEADNVEIDISSAGDAKLAGKANYFKASLSSAGDLNAFELEAKSGDVVVSSAGTARVFITEEASFKTSSAGNIEYKGEPRIKDMSTSSAGSINKKH